MDYLFHPCPQVEDPEAAKCESYSEQLFKHNEQNEMIQVAAKYLAFYGGAEVIGRLFAYSLVSSARKKLSAWMNYIYAACMLLAGTFTVVHACVVNVAFLQAYAIGECAICKIKN